jgi:hypothetical protein
MLMHPGVLEFKDSLRSLYGSRLVKVILYGSWARGTGDDDSDIDIMVVLKNIDSPGREIDAMMDSIDQINMKYHILLSVYPVSERAAREERSPLLLNVRKEGITV